MDLAARAAAVAVTRHGAAVAVPTPDEISSFDFS
jgi:sugar/nucleoside kinase (ribokinase family)